MEVFKSITRHVEDTKTFTLAANQDITYSAIVPYGEYRAVLTKPDGRPWKDVPISVFDHLPNHEYSIWV